MRTIRLILVVVCAAVGAQAADDRPVVETTLGAVRGVIEDGVAVYRGIPYAAPPVGELRWRAPQPAQAWQSTLDAAEYGPVCPQMRPSRFPEDEDCLTLNVWTPGHVDRPVPVMVWIHGGAHVNGSGRTDAAAFAEEGVVLAVDPHVSGARHGGEVAYVFNRLAPITVGEQMATGMGVPAGEYAPSPRDRQVAAMVQRYWIQFAKTGSPNDVGLPVWPAYDAASDPALLISNDGIGVRYRLRRERLDFVERGYEEGR